MDAQRDKILARGTNNRNDKKKSKKRKRRRRDDSDSDDSDSRRRRKQKHSKKKKHKRRDDDSGSEDASSDSRRRRKKRKKKKRRKRDDDDSDASGSHGSHYSGVPPPSTHVQRNGNVLTIPRDGNRQWIQTEKKALYVRTCYDELAKLIDEKFDEKPHLKGVAIMGTPGIGKSCFLDFLLNKMLGENKTVIYVYAKRKVAYLFENKSVEKLKIDDVMDICDERNIDMVLIDPPEGEAENFLAGIAGTRFILALSPTRDKCKGLRKKRPHKLYMGPLSKDEAVAMHAAVYADELDRSVVEERYAEIGGIPRYLFEADDDTLEDHRARCLAALHDIAVNALRIDSVYVPANYECLWSLYHLHPLKNLDDSTNYRKFEIVPCVPSARFKVREYLMHKEVKALWSDFNLTDDGRGTLKGIRFEAYAHKKILVDGIQGVAVGLTQNGVSASRTLPFEIPARSKEVILVDNSMDTLGEALNAASDDGPHGHYLMPYHPNFPVVDSVYKSRSCTLLLQMKAGRSNPLSPERKALMARANCRDIIIVVPNDYTITKKIPLRGQDNAPNQYRFTLRED